MTRRNTIPIWQHRPDPAYENYAWRAIDAQKVSNSIAYVSSVRRKTVCITLMLKLHGLTRAKENELLWTHICATNLTAALLNHIWSEIGDENKYDLVAHISCELEAKHARAQARKEAEAQKEQDEQKLKSTRRRKPQTEQTPFSTPAPGERSSTLCDILQSYYTHVPGLSGVDYPITSALRRGVIEHCATMLIVWDQRVRQFVGGATKQTSETNTDAHTKIAPTAQEESNAPTTDRYGIPNFKQTYALWKPLHDSYIAAAEIIIPFGPLRGKTLGEVRKRALRWLLYHLPSDEVIAETLCHLEVLRHPRTSPPDLLKQARNARHPWLNSRRRQRRLHASPLIQNRFNSQQKPIRLRRLSARERERLLQQLVELRDFRQKFIGIAEAVGIVLRGAPPRFPSIASIPIGSVGELGTGVGTDLKTLRECANQRYRTDLEPLRDFAPPDAKEGTKHRYTTEELVKSDAEKQAKMLAAGDAVDTLVLQPLRFVRGMKPSKDKDRYMSSFALLYARYTPTATELETKYLDLPRSQRDAAIQADLNQGAKYSYRLVLKVRGKHAPKFEEARQIHPKDLPPSGDDKFLHIYRKVRARGKLRNTLPEGQVQDGEWYKRPLYCADYPATPFPVLSRAPGLVCSVECGWKDDRNNTHQGDRLIRFLIESQRAAQQSKFESQDMSNGLVKPLEECFPSAAFGSAQIACHTNNQGHLEFYALLPVDIPVPALEGPLITISGLHEHDNGYTRALISMNGAVLGIDDIEIPAHVLPDPDDPSYSDNYVYETTGSIVQDAADYHAYIGIEDTAYLKRRPGLSRTRNRKRFRCPSVRVIDTLGYKALVRGLAQPLRTGGVSPKKDCGFCGELPENIGSIELHDTIRCYRCQSTKLHPYLHIPTMLNAVAIAYHLPGISELRLVHETVAAIFDGEITRWNDERIAVYNPQISLPDLPITAIHSVDDPTVAQIFAEYLSTIPRKSKSRKASQRLNGGMNNGGAIRLEKTTDVLRRVAGSIEYTAWHAACQTQLTVAAIRNSEGYYMTPSQASIAAAGEQIQLEDSYDLRVSLVHPLRAPDAYPIVCPTWVVILKEQRRSAQAKTLTDFLYWIVNEGHDVIARHNRTPLPKPLCAAVIVCLERVTVRGVPIFAAPKATGDGERHERRRGQRIFRPRRVRGTLISGGNSEHQHVYQACLSEYQLLMPEFSVEARMPGTVPEGSYPLRNGMDFVLTDTALTDRELHEVIAEDDTLLCLSCGRSWKAREAWFSCGRCGARLLARDNVALSVARHAREQVCDYADRLWKKRSKSTSKSTG